MIFVWSGGSSRSIALALPIPAAVLGALLFRLTAVPWQVLPAVVMVAVFGYLVIRWRAGEAIRLLRSACRRSGNPPAIVSSVLITVAAAGIALVALRLTGQFAFLTLSPALLVIAAVGNAVFEEVLWRGVMQRLLLRTAPAVVATAGQAISFGASHWTAGYPSGPIGAGLATLFGVALGVLARKTRSLLLSVCVHAVVDATIFAALFLS